MDSKIIVQKIRKEYSRIEVAVKYYSIISVLNNLNLTERQIELLAHTAIRGNISSATSKEEFIKIYGSSRPTINNMISKLTKIGLLVKTGGRIVVNPVIQLDFTKMNYILQINLLTKDEHKQINTSNNA